MNEKERKKLIAETIREWKWLIRRLANESLAKERRKLKA